MRLYLYTSLMWTMVLFPGVTVGQPAEYWRKIAQDEIKNTLKIQKNTNVAKNVILFIGDGFGVETLTAARIYRGQKNGQSGEENSLNFERFPNVALSKTYETDRQTPDSAGTATALLCGIKTKFLTLGMDDRVKVKDCLGSKGSEVTSILDWSHGEGKSTGLVTTARITHGTPSPAYGHLAYRYWEGHQEILLDDPDGNCKDAAYQLVHENSFINVLLGGGRRYFLKANQTDPETGEMNSKHGRLDGHDLVQDWIDKMEKDGARHKYVWKKSDFDDIDPQTTDHVLGLFEPSHMQWEVERNQGPDGEPSLAEMTEKAIKILNRNKKGFFLMVEGGRIDHGHHKSQAKLALEETLTFEDAVDVALKLTDESDTLIIVTGDHAHTMTLSGYATRGNDILGVVDTDTATADDGMPFTTLGYANGPGYLWGNRTNITTEQTVKVTYKQAGAVPLLSETHGAQDVAIFAKGPMSHLIHSVQEQHYVCHVMAYASCVGSNKEHCTSAHVNNADSLDKTVSLLCVLMLSVINFIALY